MKKTLFSFLFVIGCVLCSKAQSEMNIFLNDGTIYQIPVSTIDSITYTNQNPGLPAIITTMPVGLITSTSGVSGGIISDDGGSSITSRGVCWSTGPNPSTANNHTVNGSGITTFSSSISGLLPNTVYYVRSYAINNAGTAYGNEVSFMTSGSNFGTCSGGPNTVTDIDGNVYNVVTIGSQCWTKENLKVTHFNDGTPIPSNLSGMQLQSATSGACLDYDNSPANSSIYGKLYNWYTIANPAGLCPAGWHVPSDSEWNTLITYINPAADTSTYGWQDSISGGHLKTIGDAQSGSGLWQFPNTGALDTYGFSALPAGFFSDIGGFWGIGSYCTYWSSSLDSNGTFHSYIRAINSADAGISRNSINNFCGYSIRCVKD